MEEANPDSTAWASAAVLRGLVDQHVLPTKVGVDCDEHVALVKGARQGVPGAPAMWNYVASAFARPLIKSWEGIAPVEWCPASLPWPIIWHADNALWAQRTPSSCKTVATPWHGLLPNTGDRSVLVLKRICARTAATLALP